ncbi:MAG TPA: bifunctional nuclease family protein [Armatimonadota bacterium]|nr:bifunctional nuclease family protein [Armatimonadota bacterium]
MSEVRVRVWRVEPYSPSLYLLILLDERQHLLPMTIGLCEAMAIQSMVRSDRGLPRPTTTHDLMGEFITRLGGRVAKVVIDDLWNTVYFAKLHIALNGEVVTIDSRPSDAVAIALRMEAPLFATESVIAAANEPEEPPDSSVLDDESPDIDTDDL